MSTPETQSTQAAPVTRRPPMIFLFTTVFLFSVGMSLVFPVLPFLVMQYVPTESQQAAMIGWLGASFALVSFFASPVMGALSDAYGRRPILIISLLLSAIGYAIFGIGGSLWVLFLGRILDGLSAGSMSAMFGYLADTTPEEERGAVFGRVGAVVGVGMMIGPAIGGALSMISLSAPFFVAAGVCLLNMLWGALVLPESLAPERRSRQFDIAQLNPMFQLRAALAYPLVRRLVVVSMLFMLPFMLLEVALPLLSRDALQWGPEQVSTAFIVIGVCDIVAQGFLLPLLMKWLGEAGVAQLGITLGVCGMICLALLVGFPSAALLYLGLIVLCTGQGLFTAALDTLLSLAAPADEQGRVQGGAQACGSLAQVVGPIAAGQFYGRLGPGVTFGAGAALVLGALGVMVGSRKAAVPAVEAEAGSQAF